MEVLHDISALSGMKILVLCYEYPPVGGGGGRVAAEIAAALAQRGHAVNVITAGLRHLPRREVRDGVDILRPRSFRKREDTCTVPEMALYLICSLLPAWRHILTWKPDVIHAHFAVPTGALAFILHRVTGVPYVLTAHLGDVPGGVPEQTDHLFKKIDPLVRPIWKKAREITAVSSFVSDLAGKAYGVKATVIPNGVKEIPAVFRQPHHPIRIVMAGRLSVQKNPLLAIESLARMEEAPSWHCEIIGEGPLGDAMRSLAAERGLQKHVTFHGWLPAGDVARIMSESDILLMTSLHEGLPMAAIEAMQHGLAIVGSKIGGMRDVVDEDINGYLCPLSPDAFAEKLRLLADSPEKLATLKKASLNKAGQFGLKHIVDAYESVLSTASSPEKSGISH